MKCMKMNMGRVKNCQLVLFLPACGYQVNTFAGPPKIGLDSVCPEMRIFVRVQGA
jgi:hypothetical protein